MVNIPEIPKKKTIAFASLGIILYIGSSYLNILKTGSGDIGVYLGIGLIVVSTLAQIINWIRFWKED